MAKGKPYRLHLLAWEEIEDADNWYSRHSADASVGFVSDVFDAIKRIREAPSRWP
jgi:hypothetical protein